MWFSKKKSGVDVVNGFVEAYEALLKSGFSPKWEDGVCLRNDAGVLVRERAGKFVPQVLFDVVVPRMSFVPPELPVYSKCQDFLYQFNWAQGPAPNTIVQDLSSVLGELRSDEVSAESFQRLNDLVPVKYTVDVVSLRSAARGLHDLLKSYKPVGFSNEYNASSAAKQFKAVAGMDVEGVVDVVPFDLAARIRKHAVNVGELPVSAGEYPDGESVRLSRPFVVDEVMKQKLSSLVCAVYAATDKKDVLDKILVPVWRHVPVEYEFSEREWHAFTQAYRADSVRQKTDVVEFQSRAKLLKSMRADCRNNAEQFDILRSFFDVYQQEFMVDLGNLGEVVADLSAKNKMKRKFSLLDQNTYVGRISEDAVRAYLTGSASKDSAFGLIDKDAVRNALMYDYQYSENDPVTRRQRPDADEAIKMLCDACEASSFYDVLAPVLPSFVEKFSRERKFPHLDGTYLSPFAKKIVEKAIPFLEKYDGKTPAQQAANTWAKQFLSRNRTYEDFKREFC